MKRSSLVMLLLIVSMSATGALAKRVGRSGEARGRDREPVARWVPETIWKQLRGRRGKGTQGPQFQGGMLERSVVRGEIDSDLGRSLKERAFEGFQQGARPFVVKVVGEMKDPCLPPERTLKLYELEIRGKNPCAEETLVPEVNRVGVPACEQAHWEAYRGKAMAVEGGWGTRGEYVASSGRPSFSTFTCLSGVVAKCMRLGYRPWEGEGQGTLFQTCVRAARADYCGTGTSYTCEGTQYDIVDASSIQTRETDVSGETLEGDWTPEGARCLNTARLSGCSKPTDMQRLLGVIAQECAANHHPIQIGGCEESCAEGATCGSPIRTWAVTGQTNWCETSREYCPGAGQ